jgi:hypothetical protein
MHDDHAKEQRRGQNLGSLFDERKIGYFSLAWRCFQEEIKVAAEGLRYF